MKSKLKVFKDNEKEITSGELSVLDIKELLK